MSKAKEVKGAVKVERSFNGHVHGVVNQTLGGYVYAHVNPFTNESVSDFIEVQGVMFNYAVKRTNGMSYLLNEPPSPWVDDEYLVKFFPKY